MEYRLIVAIPLFIAGGGLVFAGGFRGLWDWLG